jgi:hypothetical protein
MSGKRTPSLVIRPAQRRVAHQVQVIADQHQIARLQALADAARRIGQHHRLTARRDQRSHRQHHRLQAVPFIGMDAALHQQHLDAGMRRRSACPTVDQPSCVTDYSRSRKANLGIVEARCIVCQRVGVAAQARSEHERNRRRGTRPVERHESGLLIAAQPRKMRDGRRVSQLGSSQHIQDKRLFRRWGHRDLVRTRDESAWARSRRPSGQSGEHAK